MGVYGGDAARRRPEPVPTLSGERRGNSHSRKSVKSADSLMLTSELIEKLGISRAQLKPILTRLKIEPTEVRPRHGGGCIYLWDRTVAGRVRRTNEYKVKLARNERLRERARVEQLQNAAKVAAIIDRRRQLFTNVYADEVLLLADAAWCMLLLNRAIKERSTLARFQKEVIYHLKNQLIKILCQSGFCTDVVLHEQVLLGRECWDCIGECRCGFYRPKKAVKLALFTFCILRETYSWHQPCDCIDWVSFVGPPCQKLSGFIDPKPQDLKPASLAVARELIEFAISRFSNID